MVYNCPLDDELDEAGHVAIHGINSSVGEIVADILDSMAAPLAGIIGDGQPGSGYIQAELDALDTIPPKVVLCSESVDEALRRVLHFAPGFALWVDPASRKARFFDLRALEPKTVRGVGGHVLRQRLQFSTDNCYSACTILGSPELVDVCETLTPAWDPGLEADWTSDKAKDFPDTYGLVWRLFATSAPEAEFGALESDLFATGDPPFAAITIAEPDRTRGAMTNAVPFDDTHLLLNEWARELDPQTGAWRAASVRARFAYRKGRVSGRFPASGHTGNAHDRRGVTRELCLVVEERGKQTIRGTVDDVLSPTSFRVRLGLAAPNDLAGMPIEFNGDGIAHTIAEHGGWNATLAAAPQHPIEAGDSFAITIQDDTLPRFEGGTLSLLQKLAKECLNRLMDELVAGSVPLTGLDWTLRPGLAVSFSDTNDPEYASLGAVLIEVEHDIARERTVLSLTTAMAMEVPSWAALARLRRRGLEADEVERQFFRLRRRHRRRSALRGAVGDPHELDPNGPIVGDGVRIDVANNRVTHIGPGPVDRTLGGTGRYIEWVTLDLRGHLIQAGVGTFS